MSSTLSEGVRVPDIGSTSWGADVNFNWGLLNTALANITGNVKVNVANTWTAPQTFTETISGSIDGVAARAVGDEDGNNIKTALASKAEDDQVVHLAGAETITGDKTFTGAVAMHNITPETDGTYSLGSSSYQWSAVYAQSYYYNGTAWGLDKSNVWTGNNTFTSAITTKTNVDRTVAPTSDSTYGTIVCRDKNGSAMLRMQGTIKTDLSNVWDMMMVAPNNSYITFFRYTISSSSSDRELRFKATSVIPDDNSTADLGTSTNKWKTLNGINPGALSIPNLSANNRVDISASIVADSNNNIRFTPQIYGWVYIDFNVASATITSGTEMYAQAKDNSLANTDFAMNFIRPANSNHIFVWMPVWENKQIIIEVNFSGFSVGKAYIYPCLGNV